MEREKGFAGREFLKTSMLAGSGIFIGSRLLTDGGYEVQAQTAQLTKVFSVATAHPDRHWMWSGAHREREDRA